MENCQRSRDTSILRKVKLRKGEGQRSKEKDGTESEAQSTENRPDTYVFFEFSSTLYCTHSVMGDAHYKGVLCTGQKKKKFFGR